MDQDMIYGISVAELVAFVRRLAYKLVRRLPPHIRVGDLVSAGQIGFLEARRRFDPARGKNFMVFAEYRIRGAMLDALRGLDPLSRDQRAATRRIALVKHELTIELGRPPEEEELAFGLGLTLAKFYAKSECENVAQSISLDELVENGEEPTVDSGSVEDVLIGQIDARRITARAVECLDGRRANVVLLYYRDEFTLRQIGDYLGVTESRVCQLLREALEAMYAHCAP